MQEPRLFTFEEASALLPRLREILAELRAAREQMAEGQRKIEARNLGGARSNGHVQPSGDTEQFMSKTEEARNHITKAVRAISDLGCELKDPDRGMVDFRTMRDQRVVYLCWLMHEPAITFWHEIDGGFGGRQSL